MLDTWLIWVILAAAFIIGEIFTAGFFILWFGVGALAAAVVAFLGLNAGWQWGAFVIVSGILLAISRKFADRFAGKQPPGIGADRYVGKEGIVLEDIDNAKNTGRIRVEEEEWRAKSESGEVISAGKTVKVLKIEGTRLLVKSK